MRQAPTELPDWAVEWNTVMARLAEPWDLRVVTEGDVSRRWPDTRGSTSTSSSPMPTRAVARLRFTRWLGSRCCAPPTQALVTVNPDAFVLRVAGRFNLAEHFDTIVVSCLEGTTNKTELCEIALDRLGYTGDRAQTLLIDNRDDVTESWERTGGAAYHYRGDDRFATDLPPLLR